MKDHSEDTFSQYSKRLVDKYSAMLLGWAYNKLGDRRLAEELVQEVWLQVFTALRKSSDSGLSIQKEDHFIWKIARYVWCNYLRQKEKRKMCVSLDSLEYMAGTAEADCLTGMDGLISARNAKNPVFAEESGFVSERENEEDTKELISYMRQQILNLNRLQREILILYYIDRRPQKEIARMLGVSLSAVKWHLFDTRKKLKEDLITMKTTSAKNTPGNTVDFVYRPKRLHVGINGQGFPPLDTQAIDGSLTRQNICIACYRTPQTLDMLAKSLGIPKAYLEFDLKWLVEKEFLSETAQGYGTDFLILSEKERQAKDTVWLAHKNHFSDGILNHLAESEEKIRAIGFHGNDMPFDRLLWLLIYHYCNYQKCPFVPEGPVRPDGGRYFPLGFVREDFPDEQTYREHTDPALCRYGWGCNGSMHNDNFWWYGLYNFGASEIEDLLDGRTPRWGQLHSLLCRLLHSDGDISSYGEDEKYALAELAEKGFITISGTRAEANFCVFTRAQYNQLQEEIFAPLKEKLALESESLEADFRDLSESLLPARLQSYQDLFVQLSLTDAAYMTTVLAFNEDRLYVPKDRHEGEFLTMMYIV